MPHHHYVATKRLKRAYRVVERLALFHGRPGPGDVRDVRREGLRCELERHPRARRRLGEEQDDRAAAERRRSTDGPLENLGHRARLIENRLDLFTRPVVRVEHMPSGPAHGHARTLATTSTRWTRTSSPAVVGMFLPTKSARMGSSR